VVAALPPGTCSSAQQPPPTSRPAAVSKASPQPAEAPPSDWDLSDPTTWWYCVGVTSDQVAQFLETNKARLVDVEVEQTTPTLLLSVVAVANQGRYANSWWWYFGLDDAQIQEKLSTNGARPTALKPYVANGQTRFAVIMVASKPPTNKAFVWYPDLDTVQQLQHLLQVNKAAVSDVDPYLADGQRKYAAVALVDPSKTMLLDNVPLEQISAEVTRVNGHVIDIEPYDLATGTFDAIVEACPCAKNWWAAGVDEAGLVQALADTHGRITSMASYAVNGQRRFAVSLIDNT
jgi:hypothetical protein